MTTVNFPKAISATVLCLLVLATSAEAGSFRDRLRERIAEPSHPSEDAQRENSARRPSARSISLPKGAEPHVIDVNGQKRRFFVYRPAGLSGETSSLIALHGGGGDAARFMSSTTVIEQADAIGFLAVFPEGIDGNWNDGRAKFVDRPSDIDFMRALVRWLVKNERVDSRRVFATGTSNGGSMAHKIACDAPGLVAGIAPISANFNQDLHASCAPGQPTPVIMFNGTDDPLMLFEGGTPDIPGREAGGSVLSTMATAAFWARVNGCHGTPRARDLKDRVDDGTTVTMISYQCPQDEVTLFRINGGGHGVPGGEQPTRFRARMIGTTSQEIDAFAQAARFLSRYGL